MIEIQIENIKCGGCANSIVKGLKEDSRVQSVDVDVDNGVVKLAGEGESLREDMLAKLLKMGYPETGSVEGLKAAKAKATSFVSCAVGRISDSSD